MTVPVCMLLGLAVTAAWLAALAFLRLRTALDRLHCASFVVAAGAPALTIAALLQDGLSSRACKIMALLVVLLASGAATSHAVGRAIYLRDGADR